MLNEAFEVLAHGLLRENNVSRRKMFGWDCLFVNGNAFLGGSDRGMLFKLEVEDLQEAIHLPGIQRFDPMGTGKGMLGWVMAERGTEHRWPGLSLKALEYVSALAPKGAAKPKKKSPVVTKKASPKKAAKPRKKA